MERERPRTIPKIVSGWILHVILVILAPSAGLVCFPSSCPMSFFGASPLLRCTVSGRRLWTIIARARDRERSGRARASDLRLTLPCSQLLARPLVHSCTERKCLQSALRRALDQARQRKNRSEALQVARPRSRLFSARRKRFEAKRAHQRRPPVQRRERRAYMPSTGPLQARRGMTRALLLG